jgi:hypothetical protein
MMTDEAMVARGRSLVLLEHAFGLPFPAQITSPVVDKYAALIAQFPDAVIVLPAIAAEYSRRVAALYVEVFGSMETAEAYAQRRNKHG